MDLESIFKRPPLPKGSLKRKFEPTEVDDAIKAVRLGDGAAPGANGSGRVTIEDVDEDAEDRADDDDGFAPDNFDPDYLAEDDEDGRFYGGGLSTTQKEILNIMETGEAEGSETAEAKLAASTELTPQSVKRQLLALERSINKNREMRTRFPTDPAKFVDSEFALIQDLRSLLLFSSLPELTYPFMIENKTLASLSDLLSHENMDVVVQTIEILEDWTDEEVLDVEPDDEEDEDEADEKAEKRRDALAALTEQIEKEGTVSLVVSSISRFDEALEDERAGVYHVLSLLENLIALKPSFTTELVSPKSPLLAYLVKRLADSKQPSDRDQNRYYAAELLAVLLAPEIDGVNEGRKRIADEKFVDSLLEVLSVYRKRDPDGADETEFMENVFDLLCSSLSEPAVKRAFLAGEGVELMVIMMKNNQMARMRAVKALDHALGGGAESIELCEKFVDALGLKTLFSAFMGKKAGKKAAAATHEDTEHILAILASLFTSLASDSAPRLRLLTKFIESDYEKADRLLELREEVERRVAAAAEVEGFEDLDEDDIYLEKLEKGLFSLQLTDYIIGWLCMEDDGVRDHIIMLLDRKGRTLNDVGSVLAEYRDNIGDGGEDEPEGNAGELREIIRSLLLYLEGVLAAKA